MNLINLNKKAASPMIATIILLVFALTLGFLLVNLTPHIEVDEDICQDIYSIRVLEIKNYPYSICQELDVDEAHKSVKFFLKNDANLEVSGLHLTFIGDSFDPIYILRDYNTTIKPGSVVSKKYLFPKTIGDLKQVMISIYRKLDDSDYLCKKYSIALDSIPECEGQETTGTEP